MANHFRAVSLFCLYLQCLIIQASFYSSNSGVVDLNSVTLAKTIKTHPVVLVEFYTPGCGHCQQLKPSYLQLPKLLKDIAVVAAFDVSSNDKNGEIQRKYKLTGFPTIKLFLGPKTIIDYSGNRQADDMAGFVKRFFPSKVEHLTASTLQSFLDIPDMPKALLVGPTRVIPFFVQSLSVTLLKRLRFGHLLSSEKESVLKVGVTKFPSLIAFRTGETNPITFDKDLADTVAVKSFLNSVSLPPDISSLSIFNISDNSCLRKYCMDSGAQVCVLGLNPGAGGSVALAALDEASTSIPNRQWYSFGWIDARKQASFSGNFGVIPDAFKIVIWFHRKMKYVVYTGSMDADSITKYISSAVTGKFPPSTLEAEPKLDGDSINCPPIPVKQQKQKKMSKPISFNTRLNDNNFDKLVLKSKSIWMVVFARDNCGYCQQLAPHWAKAADSLQGAIQFGTIKDSPIKFQKYSITGVPTVMLFHPDKTKPVPCNERTKAGLWKFATGFLPNDVPVLKTVAAAQKWANSSDLPRFVLISKKSSAPVVLRSLALEYTGVAKVAAVSFSNQALKAWSVNVTAPCFLAFSKGFTGNGAPTVYNNSDVSFQALNRFFSTFVGPSAPSAKARAVSKPIDASSESAPSESTPGSCSATTSQCSVSESAGGFPKDQSANDMDEQIPRDQSAINKDEL